MVSIIHKELKRKKGKAKAIEVKGHAQDKLNFQHVNWSVLALKLLQLSLKVDTFAGVSHPSLKY